MFFLAIKIARWKRLWEIKGIKELDESIEWWSYQSDISYISHGSNSSFVLLLMLYFSSHNMSPFRSFFWSIIMNIVLIVVSLNLILNFLLFILLFNFLEYCFTVLLHGIEIEGPICRTVNIVDCLIFGFEGIFCRLLCSFNCFSLFLFSKLIRVIGGIWVKSRLITFSRRHFHDVLFFFLLLCLLTLCDKIRFLWAFRYGLIRFWLFVVYLFFSVRDLWHRNHRINSRFLSFLLTMFDMMRMIKVERTALQLFLPDSTIRCSFTDRFINVEDLNVTIGWAHAKNWSTIGNASLDTDRGDVEVSPEGECLNKLNLGSVLLNFINLDLFIDQT